ncbi:MAG TPA: hypothetical protein DCY31_04925 [Ruminococcaceae bacterium]|nr:hypothetical protein [Oscillospiraceae bacterium]
MIRSVEKKRSERVFSIILTVLLFAFLALVFYVNLSCNPEYYNGDIYNDIRFAKEAWKAKSLFPDGWVFGNQVYVAATPVLAAALYGFIGDGFLAMGIASCIMTVFVLLSFNYMTRVIFSYNERFAGFLVMVTVIFARAHIAIAQKGAQVYFTMASYYSCYMITAFIIYGCYIRLKKNDYSKKSIPIVILSLVLTFAMGMQSLRQTVVMVLPLLACDFLMTITETIKHKSFKLSLNTMFSLAVIVANILGLIVIKQISFEQTSIFGGDIYKFEIHNVISKIIEKFIMCIIGSFQSYTWNPYLNILAPLICLTAIFGNLIIEFINTIKNKFEYSQTFVLNLLLLLSVVSVFCVDVLTDLISKTIYYFMIFPLLAVSFSNITKRAKKIKAPIYLVVFMCFAVTISMKWSVTYTEVRQGKNIGNVVYQMSDYMLSNGYDTLFTPYVTNGQSKRGESVIVASKDRLNYIFVDYREKDIYADNYLRMKDDYKFVDNAKSLYYIEEKNISDFEDICDKYNVKIVFKKKFENYYLCKLSDNVCKIAEGQRDKK